VSVSALVIFEVSFAAIPVDYLLAKIQWLDARGSALMDCVSTQVAVSPVLRCQRSIATMIVDGSSSGPLRPLLRQWADDVLLPHCARKVLLCFGTQLWWRCEPFYQYPFKFAQLFSVSAEEQRRLLEEFFALSRCCMDEEFTCKVRDMFGSVEDFLKCEKLIDGLRLWARMTKITNMHLERLLSLIKRALGGLPSPDVERLVSVGMLAQVLRGHLGAGGDDPRVVTRSMLLADDVPIAAGAVAQPSESKSKPAGAFFFFKAAKQKDRKVADPTPLTKEQLRDELLRLRTDWKNLSQADAQQYVDSAKSTWLSKQRSKTEAQEDIARTRSDQACRMSHNFFGLGSQRWPITPENFEESVRCRLGLAPEAALPGHRVYCTTLRKQWLERMVVETGTIPDNADVKVRMTCWECHAGLCVTRDSWCWQEALPLFKKVRDHFLQLGDLGGFYRIVVLYKADVIAERRLHVCLGHKRKAAPKLLLFARCSEIVEGSREAKEKEEEEVEE
jgi:hypothetical protein